MFLANAIFDGDSYKRQYVIDENDRFVYTLVGRAELTDVLQNVIPLRVFSAKPNSLQGNFPPLPMQVLAGGQINRVDVRLPRQAASGDEPIFGVELPKNCTLIGTTGELLKVTPTTGIILTVPSPVIACQAGNAYTPNAQSVLSRSEGISDQASPSLLTTVPAVTPFQITITNAGGTALGNGIRLSRAGAKTFIYARIVFAMIGEAVMPWNLDLPATPG